MDKTLLPSNLTLVAGTYRHNRLTCVHGGKQPELFLLQRLDLIQFDPTRLPPPPSPGWKRIPTPETCATTGEIRRWWRARRVTLVQFHLEGADEDVDDEPVCVYDWRNKSMATSYPVLY